MFMYYNKEYIADKAGTLYDFLIEKIDGNKKNIKNLLSNKKVIINNKIVTKYDYQLKSKTKVIVNTNKSSLNLLYEDKELIIVDKPAKLLTISDNKIINNLYRKVSAYVKAKNKKSKIFIVNRLDRETSGIVVFAKDINTKNLIQNDWHNAKRYYVAIVNGIAKEKDLLRGYLKEDDNHVVYQTSNASDGKLAITEYKKIRNTKYHSWLDIRIKTGRKNQIRVQLKDANLPIKGDTKYGKDKVKEKRMYLHSYKISFNHPLTNKKIEVSSLLPNEFGL